MLTPIEQPATIIVIPCLAEAEILETLDSLRKNIGFQGNIECFVVVNHSLAASEEIKSANKSCLELLLAYGKKFNSEALKFIAVEAFDLPPKKAGVGMARKVGMDMALNRLKASGKLGRGIIVCLDADCTVSQNYIASIEQYFAHHQANGCSIYFEHPLDGENTNAIIDYELFLRYYINALRWCGFPYAFQTVGSSMAVSAAAYEKQGGMNTRQAGEDFYFLNKIIPMGKFGDLTSATVYPSARKSERVPFGTGREIIEWEKTSCLLCYHPDLFLALKGLMSIVDRFHQCQNPMEILMGNKIHPSFISYLSQHQFSETVNEANANTATLVAFRKRFFVWMNAFRIMKLFNALSDAHFPKIPIHEAAAWLRSMISASGNYSKDPLGLLRQFRAIDKGFLP